MVYWFVVVGACGDVGLRWCFVLVCCGLMVVVHRLLVVVRLVV